MSEDENTLSLAVSTLSEAQSKRARLDVVLAHAPAVACLLIMGSVSDPAVRLAQEAASVNSAIIFGYLLTMALVLGLWYLRGGPFLEVLDLFSIVYASYGLAIVVLRIVKQDSSIAGLSAVSVGLSFVILLAIVAGFWLANRAANGYRHGRKPPLNV